MLLLKKFEEFAETEGSVRLIFKDGFE